MFVSRLILLLLEAQLSSENSFQNAPQGFLGITGHMEEERGLGEGKNRWIDGLMDPSEAKDKYTI